MLSNLLGPLSQLVSNISILVFVLNVILHIIFASGVARDLHQLDKRHIPPQFIPGYAWILATLIGGIFVLAVYWVIHHSTLARHN